MRPIVATLALFLVTAAGCQRGAQCKPGAPSKLELRNGSGALTLAWVGDDLCDGQWKRVGTLEAKPEAITLRDLAGKLRLEVTRESAEVGHARDQAGAKLRLYRDAKELRVLTDIGVPLGSVVPQTTRGAVVYNPGSSPLAKVSLREPDAVVTDMAGTALTYVHPSAALGPAGVFAIPSLDPSEALAIYIYWSR
jgi:hypothetical protein